MRYLSGYYEGLATPGEGMSDHQRESLLAANTRDKALAEQNQAQVMNNLMETYNRVHGAPSGEALSSLASASAALGEIIRKASDSKVKHDTGVVAEALDNAIRNESYWEAPNPAVQANLQNASNEVLVSNAFRRDLLEGSGEAYDAVAEYASMSSAEIRERFGTGQDPSGNNGAANHFLGVLGFIDQSAITGLQLGVDTAQAALNQIYEATGRPPSTEDYEGPWSWREAPASDADPALRFWVESAVPASGPDGGYWVKRADPQNPMPPTYLNDPAYIDAVAKLNETTAALDEATADTGLGAYVPGSPAALLAGSMDVYATAAMNEVRSGQQGLTRAGAPMNPDQVLALKDIAARRGGVLVREMLLDGLNAFHENFGHGLGYSNPAIAFQGTAGANQAANALVWNPRMGSSVASMLNYTAEDRRERSERRGASFEEMKRVEQLVIELSEDQNWGSGDAARANKVLLTMMENYTDSADPANRDPQVWLDALQQYTADNSIADIEQFDTDRDRLLTSSGDPLIDQMNEIRGTPGFERVARATGFASTNDPYAVKMAILGLGKSWSDVFRFAADPSVTDAEIREYVGTQHPDANMGWRGDIKRSGDLMRERRAERQAARRDDADETPVSVPTPPPRPPEQRAPQPDPPGRPPPEEQATQDAAPTPGGVTPKGRGPSSIPMSVEKMMDINYRRKGIQSKYTAERQKSISDLAKRLGVSTEVQ